MMINNDRPASGTRAWVEGEHVNTFFQGTDDPLVATDLPCVVFVDRPPMKPIAPDNGRGKGYGGSFVV